MIRRCTICQASGNESGRPCGTLGCRNYVERRRPSESQTTGAFERGFVAGWEARGRRDEAMAVEEELRLRREAEEAKARGALSAMRVCAFCGEPTDAHGDCQSVGCVGWRTPERASQWSEEMKRAVQQQGRQLTEAELREFARKASQ